MKIIELKNTFQMRNPVDVFESEAFIQDTW